MTESSGSESELRMSVFGEISVFKVYTQQIHDLQPFFGSENLIFKLINLRQKS